MNKLYDKALKANVARTEIAGDVNTKWTPDAIKIKKEKDKKELSLEEAYNAIVKGLGILVDYPNKVIQDYLVDDGNETKDADNLNNAAAISDAENDQIISTTRTFQTKENTMGNRDRPKKEKKKPKKKKL